MALRRCLQQRLRRATRRLRATHNRSRIGSDLNWRNRIECKTWSEIPSQYISSAGPHRQSTPLVIVLA